MDRVAKLFFAIAFAATVLAACNKSGGGVKVNSPRNGKPGVTKPGAKDATKDDKGKVVDESKMDPKQKAESDRVAKDIRELRPIFRDAGSLYRDLKVYLKNSDDKEVSSLNGGKNILELISHILETNFSAKGKAYVKDENKECKLGISDVKAEGDKQYNISFAPCESKANSHVIAKITREGDFWKIEFNLTELDGSAPNMMGILFPMWSAKQGSGQVLESSCRLQRMKKDSGRLGVMICKNLGHDQTPTKYVFIQNLEFYHPIAGADKRPPVRVQFSIHESLNNEAPKEIYKGEAQDRIDIGDFLVNLTKVAPEEELAQQLSQKAEIENKEKLEKAEADRKANENNEQQSQGQSTQGQPDPKDNASGVASGIQQQPSGDAAHQQDPNQHQDDQEQRQDYPPAT